MQCDCVLSENGVFTPCTFHRSQARMAASEAFERSALLVEDGRTNGDDWETIAARIRAERPLEIIL